MRQARLISCLKLSSNLRQVLPHGHCEFLEVELIVIVFFVEMKCYFLLESQNLRQDITIVPFRIFSLFLLDSQNLRRVPSIRHFEENKKKLTHWRNLKSFLTIPQSREYV